MSLDRHLAAAADGPDLRGICDWSCGDPFVDGGTTIGATILRVAKISVSLDDELYERVRYAAGSAGVSGWLADAASARLRSEVLLAVAGEIADDTGSAYTEDELSEAREWLRSSSTPAR